MAPALVVVGVALVTIDDEDGPFRCVLPVDGVGVFQRGFGSKCLNVSGVKVLPAKPRS